MNNKINELVGRFVDFWFEPVMWFLIIMFFSFLILALIAFPIFRLFCLIGLAISALTGNLFKF